MTHSHNGITRRHAIALGGAALAGAGLPTLASAAEIRPLAHPPLLDATTSRAASLTAQIGQHDFFAGKMAPTLGFNDMAYLGPVLRIAPGQTIVTVQNSLEFEISTHWHGLVIPGSSDGGPHQSVAAGSSWQTTLDIDQPPCTAWYHSHIHGKTGEHVYRGLAGVLQISDGTDRASGLPYRYGIDDVTVIIQDKLMNGTTAPVYNPSMHDNMMGILGDTMVINGQVGPTAVLPSGIIRLRLLNASNARIYNLGLKSGKPLNLIGTDGGLLDQIISLDRLPLSPGERAEVLIDLQSDDQLVSYVVDNAMNGPSTFSDRQFLILPLMVDTTIPSDVTALPDALPGSIPSVDVTNAVQRAFSLDMGMGMMAMMGGMMHSINGEHFDPGQVNFTATRNQIEVWTITAPSMMHPFHVHGARFQILTENSATPAPHNRGWKDTVLINGTAQIAVKFERDAGQDAPYMYHCHILEHEDNGMMGQFAVV